MTEIEIIKAMGLINDKQLERVSVLAALEEQPEDFESQVEAIKNDVVELFMLQHKPDTTEIEKGIHGKFLDQYRNWMRKELDIAKADVEGKSLKELQAMTKSVFADKVKAASSATDAEMAAKLDEWQTKFEQANEKAAEWESSYESKVEAANKAAEEKIYGFKKSSLLAKKYGNKEIVEWDDDAKASIYQRIITEDLDERYVLDTDTGEIRGKDGGKALCISGDGFYKTIDEAIADIADYHKITKKSHVSTKKDNVHEKRFIQTDPNDPEKGFTRSVTSFKEMFE